jgi:DNA-binding transcriptional regulator LsrR (DeoR family)
MTLKGNTKNDIRLMMMAAQLSQDGYTQVEIAMKLGIYASTVSRLLSRAREFIEVKYNFPGYEELEAKLVSHFKLIDALVVETGTDEHALEALGQAAARYFISNVEPNDRVALSCGETLLEMLKVLPTRRSLRLSISQLSIESDPLTIHQAPATLAGLLRAKSSPKSHVYGLQMPPLSFVKGHAIEFRRALSKSDIVKKLHDQALRSNVIFVGVGWPFSSGKDELHSFLRMAKEAVPDFEQIAKNLGVVGELNNQVFDNEGRNRTEEIFGVEGHIINLLSLDEIKQLASRRTECKVVLIATGERKSNAIRTALRSGMANIIITGRDDAKRLLS